MPRLQVSWPYGIGFTTGGCLRKRCSFEATAKPDRDGSNTARPSWRDCWKACGHSLPDGRCLRCLLLVMCTHPFAKKALTLHLARSEGHERYFGCNLMHRKVLASSHQHLMPEAPHLARSEGHERYFRCNLMHCKVLASFHQHLTAEAPTLHRPADSALPRTMSSTGSKACQLSTINPNDSRVSNPLVSRGRCTT